MRTATVDTITSFQGFGREVIPVLEALGLLSMVHDILDKTVSKQVGNATHILAFLLRLSNVQA